MGICRSDVKRKAQAENLRGESIEALHRDGQTRSSEESVVITEERRGFGHLTL